MIPRSCIWNKPRAISASCDQKVRRSVRGEEWKSHQPYSLNAPVSPQIFPKASVFHEVIYESQWMFAGSVRSAERDDIPMRKHGTCQRFFVKPLLRTGGGSVNRSTWKCQRNFTMRAGVGSIVE